MILEIEGLLDDATLARFQAELRAAPWSDGRATAGYQSALAKNNLQLAQDHPLGERLGAELLAALDRNLAFQSAALPARVFPPLFNLYREGHAFGAHVDNAYRPLPAGGQRLRTDLSATLFLADPAEYDGGELVIEDAYGSQSVKLAAGSMILYPSTSLHGVDRITRGSRLAAIFWVQSLVADDARRSLLFDMDISIQNLRKSVPDDDAALITLTGCYHNLLRMWGSR
ncbi:MAG: Fe2+-dependent dioxygenase [Steroidobacteraceae bacterium]